MTVDDVVFIFCLAREDEVDGDGDTEGDAAGGGGAKSSINGGGRAQSNR